MRARRTHVHIILTVRAAALVSYEIILLFSPSVPVSSRSRSDPVAAVYTRARPSAAVRRRVAAAAAASEQRMFFASDLRAQVYSGVRRNGFPRSINRTPRDAIIRRSTVEGARPVSPVRMDNTRTYRMRACTQAIQRTVTAGTRPVPESLRRKTVFGS